jgi:hypothetical protein
MVEALHVPDYIVVALAMDAASIRAVVNVRMFDFISIF